MMIYEYTKVSPKEVLDFFLRLHGSTQKLTIHRRTHTPKNAHMQIYSYDEHLRTLSRQILEIERGLDML